MNGNKKRAVCAQIRRFRQRFVQGRGSLLSRLFTERCLGQWVCEECGRWRERIYGPLRTLTLFIEQVLSADHSCQDAVALGVSARVALGESVCSLNSGPYCRARQRLALSLIERLGREVAARICARQRPGWLWRGRPVKLIDGATVSMPDTVDNQRHFPQNRGQKRGLGFPLARVVAVISLSCGAVLEWACGACEGKASGETALLWGLVDKLAPGDIVVADRCYAGYFMIARLISQGVDVVIRQHQRRRCDFRCGKRLGARDHVVSWVRPKRPAWMDEATYQRMPQTLCMREVRVGGWTIVSSLLDARTVSKKDLLALYRSRWQVELDLRSIKAVMQMDILRCKSATMVRKEIATHLLAYNLVRAVMAQAASHAALSPRQLSFKATLQLLRAFEQNLRHCPRQRLVNQHAYLLGAIAALRLPLRPDRVEPRAIKRRPATYTFLSEPRSVVRKRLVQRKEKIMASALR
jgi:hypothetical protein